MKSFFKQLLLFNFFFLSVLSLSFTNQVSLNISDFPFSLPMKSHSLWSYHNQKIHIRGFWYPLTHEKGILASTPHLKSCCVASPLKINQQLIVKGQIASLSTQRVVELEGIFRIEPLYNGEGELTQLYLLEEAQEIFDLTSFSFTILWRGLIGLWLGL